MLTHVPHGAASARTMDDQAADDPEMYAAFGRDLTALIEEYSYDDWYDTVCWIPTTRQDVLVRAAILSVFALRCAAAGGAQIERFVRQDGVTIRDLAGAREVFQALPGGRATRRERPA